MTGKRTTVGVIPARMASVRLPEKMLADLAGTPLVVVTAQSALHSKAFDRVIVATDDSRIAEVVVGHGMEALMTDPSLPSGTARVAEVARSIDADVFINVQGDEPLIDPEGLRRVAAVFDDPEIEMATLSFPLLHEDESNPNAVKLVTDVRGDALYFSRSLIPYPRNYERFAPLKHIGVYGYRKDILLRLVDLPRCDAETVESLEQLRALYHGIKIRVVPAEKDSIGIDTHADLERVRSLLERRKR